MMDTMGLDAAIAARIQRGRGRSATKYLGVRLPAGLYAALRSTAAEHGTTATAVLRAILESAYGVGGGDIQQG